jgi:hypothetical protein
MVKIIPGIIGFAVQSKPSFYRARGITRIMCGADLSDIDEEKPRERKGITRTRTCQNKEQEEREEQKA